MRNARFWLYWNGSFVKLTLRPNEELTLFCSWAHDEGWSSRTEEFYYDGKVVTRISTSDGRDCDGRHTETSEMECLTEHLKGAPPYVPTNDYEKASDYCPEPGAMFPAWTKSRSRQYDQYAEMMGY